LPSVSNVSNDGAAADRPIVYTPPARSEAPFYPPRGGRRGLRWLNRIVAVASAVRLANVVVYDGYVLR
jgi:hypothetical protein